MLQKTFYISTLAAAVAVAAAAMRQAGRDRQVPN